MRTSYPLFEEHLENDEESQNFYCSALFAIYYFAFIFVNFYITIFPCFFHFRVT